MSEPRADAFFGAGLYAANPRLYDYVHTLAFDPAGTVEMVDGAGQQLTALVRGRYVVEPLSPSESRLHLTDLVEIDPYYTLKRFRGLELDAYVKTTQGYVPHEEQDVVGRPDPFSVRVTRENGPFLLRRQIIWNLTDPEEWPYVRYPERYRFELDPLAQFAPNRGRSLYHKVEAPVMDENVYYLRHDAQHLTARELAKLGIAVDERPS